MQPCKHETQCHAVIIFPYYQFLLFSDGFFFSLSPSISWLSFGISGQVPILDNADVSFLWFLFIVVSQLYQTQSSICTQDTHSVQHSDDLFLCRWHHKSIGHAYEPKVWYLLVWVSCTAPIRILSLSRAQKNWYEEMWLYLMITQSVKKKKKRASKSPPLFPWKPVWNCHWCL